MVSIVESSREFIHQWLSNHFYENHKIENQLNAAHAHKQYRIKTRNHGKVRINSLPLHIRKCVCSKSKFDRHQLIYIMTDKKKEREMLPWKANYEFKNKKLNEKQQQHVKHFISLSPEKFHQSLGHHAETTDIHSINQNLSCFFVFILCCFLISKEYHRQVCRSKWNRFRVESIQTGKNIIVSVWFYTCVCVYVCAFVSA